VGSVCRVKRFTTGSRNSLKDVRKSQMMPDQVWEVAKAAVKILLCCRFRHTGRAMRQVYQCWRRVCREINVFPRFEYHMFSVLYPFVTYLLTHSYLHMLTACLLKYQRMCIIIHQFRYELHASLHHVCECMQGIGASWHHRS
jgi:hypothetical protein